MRNQDRLCRYYDVRAEVTFAGRVFAPTLRDGAEHVRGLLRRRLKTANLRGDKYTVLDGFTATGIAVTERLRETQKAEKAQLRALAQKYPRTALLAAVDAIERKLTKETPDGDDV